MSKRILILERCFDCPHISPKFYDGYYCYLIALMNGYEYRIEVDATKTLPEVCPLSKIEEEKT